MEQRLHCVCGEHRDVPNSCNVGDMVKSSGYSPVFTHDEMLWLCPKCAEEVRPHVEAIQKKFGEAARYLSWSGLRHGVCR